MFSGEWSLGFVPWPTLRSRPGLGFGVGQESMWNVLTGGDLGGKHLEKASRN
jgi:hypothetical protein